MEENRKVILGAVIFFILIALGVGIYYVFFREKAKEAPPSPVSEQPTQASVEKPLVEEKGPRPVEVALDQSDELVRELARGLSSNPQMASWLLSKDLIRKFTAAVDNIAQGMSPRAQVDFFSPQGRFKVIKKKGLFYPNPGSYTRYNPAVEVFLSLNVKGCVQLYRQLEAPIQEAYRELGYPEQKFDDTLILAIIELLEVPVVQTEMLLEESVISYTISDPELENLSEAQKHLLRMGPENVKKIQAKLREFASELEIPVNKLPRPRIYSP